jgi:hypothetical protein
MLGHPPREVTRHADVKNAVAFARGNVDAWSFMDGEILCETELQHHSAPE